MVQVDSALTLDELLASCGQCVDQAGYYTKQEWAGHFGVTVWRMNQLLHQAQIARRLEASRAHREAIDGSQRIVPVYRFKGVE